jgi:cobalt-zinc-cadmium efflux system membrane fusion protein
MKSQIQINGNGKTAPNGTYLVAAPISGYIVEKKISQGNFIRGDAGDNLFTIGDISDVWVWANVYETDISKVKVGYTAAVTTLAYPGNTFYGTVDEVGNILDPVTKVMRIRINLPNNKGMLKPQMFSNIVITNKEAVKAVAVFSNAIISENGKDYVVKYNSKCDLKVQQVEILKTVGDKTYIKSGLQEGEKVIAKNQILLFRALSEK